MEAPHKGRDGADPDFVWEEYLEETNSAAVPHIAFTHVEYSIESSFKVGMKLEVPSSEGGTTYWIASVIMNCGELLSLRYLGYGDDRSADFWFKIKSGEFHPVGWCKANKKPLEPPKEIAGRCGNIDALLAAELKNVESIPSPLTEEKLANGFIPIDQIKCGMKLEVKEEFNPQNVWIASIILNVGGRLLLRYDGFEDDSSHDFWTFYLSHNLDPIGNASENNLQYCPPKTLKDMHSEESWQKILKNSLKKSKEVLFPAHVLEPKIPVELHDFKEGMKLEAVNRRNYADLCPATVTKVINGYYFLVSIDSFGTENSSECIFCCHSNTPLIFPIGWAEENELILVIPKGYKTQDSNFSWEEYLKFCNAEPAPPDLFLMSAMNNGFEVGMKLEAVDPLAPNKIKAATIEKLIDPLVWIHFDNEKENSVITSVDSMDVFPVGWCGSNSYPLETPANYKSKNVEKEAAVEIKPREEKSVVTALPSLTESQGKSWCPKIYFNYRCFTGPLLSKKRLAELPQGIGPGPLHLVINEVLSRVVNIAYKSCQVLQLLQVHGKPSANMQQTVIKAKYHNKSYRATIEVIRNSKEVETFCKKICEKLECCPNLFGPTLVGEDCPSNCHTETKAKFGNQIVKKKKVSKPFVNQETPSSDSNTETIKKGPGRKKKRKHWTHLFQEAVQRSLGKVDKPRESEEVVDSPKMEVIEKKPVGESKKKLKHVQRSSIVTRGAKIPNYGLWYHVSSFHSRRGRPRIKPAPFVRRKVGRPIGSTKKNIGTVQWRSKRISEMRKKRRELTPEKDDSDEDFEEVIEIDEEMEDDEVQEIEPSTPEVSSHLDSSPLDWSVEDVVQYLKKTECAPLAPLLKEQEIDGQALMMLTIVNIQEYLHLKPEPAERFCYLIKDIKKEFFTHFAR